MVRTKYRYIIAKIHVQSDSKKEKFNYTDHSIYNCITKIVQKYYGDLGVAAVRSGLRCKYSNEKTNIIVIRVKHRVHRFISSILPLVTAIGGQVITFRTLYIGATIMQCNKFIVKHQKEFLDKEVGKMISEGHEKSYSCMLLLKDPIISDAFGN